MSQRLITIKLTQARDTISNEAYFCKGALARNVVYQEVLPNSPYACRWDATGALRRVFGLGEEVNGLYQAAYHILKECAFEGGDPSSYGDRFGHGAVLLMYEGAIQHSWEAEQEAKRMQKADYYKRTKKAAEPSQVADPDDLLDLAAEVVKYEQLRNQNWHRVWASYIQQGYTPNYANRFVGNLKKQYANAEFGAMSRLKYACGHDPALFEAALNGARQEAAEYAEAHTE